MHVRQKPKSALAVTLYAKPSVGFAEFLHSPSKNFEGNTSAAIPKEKNTIKNKMTKIWNTQIRRELLFLIP